MDGAIGNSMSMRNITGVAQTLSQGGHLHKPTGPHYECQSMGYNGVSFVYRSVEVYETFRSYFASFRQNPKLLQWRTV